jgi:hypothetical protein
VAQQCSPGYLLAGMTYLWTFESRPTWRYHIAEPHQRGLSVDIAISSGAADSGFLGFGRTSYSGESGVMSLSAGVAVILASSARKTGIA